MEPEFYAMAPEGIITVTTRIKLGDVNAENVRKLADQVEHAAAMLDEACADVIVLGCTSGSFICGEAYDQDIIRKIRSVSRPSVKATTTATAVLQAIRAFGARRVAVGTPYVDEINQRATAFLSAHGIEITQFHGLSLLYDNDINNLTRDQIRDLIRQVDSPEAEMVVLLCTSIKGADILEEMERELGKPVITAIQATFWACLNLLGITREVHRFGSLFDR